MPEITPMSETFLEVKEAIDKQVSAFRRDKGGDVDELTSAAYASFIDAYESYDPDKGASFTTWLGFVIGKALLSLARRSANKRQGLARYQKARGGEEAVDPAKRFSLKSLLLELSDDAGTVVALAVEPPPAVRLASLSLTGRQNSAHGLRKGIKGFLRDVGWTAERIAESFDEIREILS